MWHELDGEDVCRVAGGYGSGEIEGRVVALGLVGMDVDVLVIATTSKELAALRPAGICQH